MTKRILIIGGFGFLGRNLYQHLINAGYETVNIFSDIPLSHDDPLRKVFKHKLFPGSINNRRIIDEAIDSHDVIYSFAGLSGAADSISTPWQDAQINLNGQLNILEACRKKKSRTTIIFPSTRLVYGKPESLPVNENHQISPNSIYAIHKNTVEYYHLLYASLYNLDVVIFRISNPYGFSYNPMGLNYSVLNQFIHKALNHDTINIYGDGQQVRDYFYVDDLSRAMEAAIHEEAMAGNIYNIGYGTGISIIDAVKTIAKIIPGTKYKFTEWPDIEETIETGDYISDISKIMSATAWKPEVNIETGLRLTVEAYRN
jgi:nucleoside-diphosphate-sugar epimerase